MGITFLRKGLKIKRKRINDKCSTAESFDTLALNATQKDEKNCNIFCQRFEIHNGTLAPVLTTLKDLCMKIYI